ncbi:MAG: thioesterase family protein [Ilumatobacteraceae bacterium]
MPTPDRPHALLALAPMPEPDALVGAEVPDPGHVFGGLLVGQAVMAANETVAEDRLPCSVHASFLSSGRGGEPIRYEVERTRDGPASALAEWWFAKTICVSSWWRRSTTTTTRTARSVLDPARSAECPIRSSARRVATPSPWFRCPDVPPEASRSPGTHPLLLVRAAAARRRTDAVPSRGDRLRERPRSDSAAREPHTGLHTDGARMSVSLDHSVWLHRPARIDQWLLLELAPVATGHARGLAMGHLWTRSGELVATIAQEVLLRTL